MNKRSVILKITRLFPKKSFAKLIDFHIELESIGKLLLKFFYTNYHILIVYAFFFNTLSSSLKFYEFCKILSEIMGSSHSEVMFTQFTSSLFLTLYIVTGIVKSFPL